MDPARAFLRHTLAALAYRAAKPLRDAPPGFADFADGKGGRTPRQLVAHMGDLFDWALSMAVGKEVWADAAPLEWSAEVARFFDRLRAFDAFLAGDAAPACALERLFQGPVADALTHTGQLALLRRQAGAAIKGENYFRADVVAGRLGLVQTPPVREF